MSRCLHIILAVCMLLGCSRANRESESGVAVDTGQAMPTISEKQALSKVLEIKLQERLEAIKLQMQYPDFKTVGVDSSFFKTSITAVTELDSITILDKKQIGDTLWMQLAIVWDDSLTTEKERMDVALVTKVVQLNGESVTTKKWYYGKDIAGHAFE
ncbi:hypothetical protein [Maribacter sp. 2-571]|uniref:hypothetical protein n=1 Tax=Maribacter sp. 2-571 TaxID=3417569 RepID=UPI003D336772